MITPQFGWVAMFVLVAATGAMAQADSPAVRLLQPSATASSGALGPALAMPADAQPDPIAFAAHANELAARVPRLQWDAGMRGAALGPELASAFAYVRDAIRYEAYAGVLRGAAGTYTARAGNAVDRALLLTQFLQQHGVKTRFAFGTLTAADQQRLWLRIFDTSIPLAPAAAGGNAERMDPTAAAKDFRQRLYLRAARDFGVVRPALGERLPPVTSPSREEVLAEMNPHVWVQAEVGGEWVDLDPSLPDGKVGTPLTKVERTAAALPAEWFQRVSIRLVLEQLDGDKLVNTTVLEFSRNATDLVDQQIFVAHAPGKPIEMAGLGAALSGYVTWTPGLWIGGDFTWGKTFTIDERGGAGAVADAKEAPKPRGRGLLDAVDALAPEPGTGSSAEPTAPVFVAEWLEFELSGPGAPTEITRRVLAERGGAAWRATQPRRAAGLRALQRDGQGPVAMRAVHNVWFSAGTHNVADYADSMQDLAIEVLGLAAGDPPSDNADFGARMWPTALQNFAWMVWTDHAVVPTLNETAGVRLYAARPRIAIFTMGPDGSDGTTMFSDLRRDDLRGLAVAPAQGTVLAEKKLWFALLQGSLEHEGIAQMLASGGGDPATVETTSRWLGADGVVVLTPGSPLPASPRQPDPESAQRLTAALGAGAVVVAPVAGLGPAGAWWEIVAGTGEARAVGELGLHSGHGGIPGNNNPLRHIKPPQQNSYGGQRPSYTPEAAKEARNAARQAQNERRAAEAARKYRQAGNNLGKSAQRGGTEYTVLVTAIMLVGSAAEAALFYHIATQMMAAADALGAM